MRLIDANTIEYRNITHQFNDLCVVSKRDIDAMLTIDAVVVNHAAWIGERGDYICSNCGDESPNDGYCKSYYCPHCGSKMDDNLVGGKNE